MGRRLRLRRKPRPQVPLVSLITGISGISGEAEATSTAREDHFIEGRIEGKITVKKGSVTVGEKGPRAGGYQATNIQVADEIEGDLNGREQVVRLETGRVHGNIKAKSVMLQNGAPFKGGIDMESAGGGRESQASGAVSGKSNGSPQGL